MDYDEEYREDPIPCEDNLHDWCESCEGYCPEDEQLNVMQDKVERFICEQCYDSHLDWYNLIL